MNSIRIRKCPNRKVRNPETGEALVEGREYVVEDSVHWRRRIQSGDVSEIVAEDDKTQKDAAKKAAAEAKQKAEEEAKRKSEEEAEEKRIADEEAAKKAAAKVGGKKK